MKRGNLSPRSRALHELTRITDVLVDGRASRSTGPAALDAVFARNVTTAAALLAQLRRGALEPDGARSLAELAGRVLGPHRTRRP